MLSSQDLAELREGALLGMPDTVEFRRPGADADPMGGTGGGVGSVLGTSPCALTTNLSSAALVGDDQRTSADGLLVLPGDLSIDVQPQDQAVVAGEVYEVQGRPERSGRWQITKRLLVARL